MKYSRKMTDFLKCFLKNSRMSARKIENEQTTHKNFIWDLTCKDISEINQFCYRTRSIEPRCHVIMESIRKWSADVGPVEFLSQLANKTELPFKKLDADLDHFMAHQTCQDRVSSSIQQCLQHTRVASSCTKSAVQLVNAVRLKMTNIGTILPKVPDLKVIHFLRDPRSVAYKRISQGGKEVVAYNFLNITEKICREMSRDIYKRRELEKMYADKFIEIRYEDLFLDPAVTLDRVYSHIGLSSPTQSVTWMSERAANATMNSFKESGNAELVRLAATIPFNEKCHFIMKKF